MPKNLPRPVTRRSPEQALRAVTSKSGKDVYASADHLYKGAVFGRDSLEVAEDLIYIKPKLVRRILLTIASLQGEVKNDLNEEEPGRIVHEYRTPVVDGKKLDPQSKEIYDRLSSMWGGDGQSLAYYGSVDATPLFIKVLSKYCQEYGLEILTEQVTMRSGATKSIVNIYEDALSWLARHLDESQSGFVEYRRRNSRGIENQVWKDSSEFYIHKNGELANHSRPISSIETQALAYDALLMIGEILPSHRQENRRLAAKIGRLIFDLLWMEDVNYFALGTDFSAKGEQRVIKTMTANPAAMLDSLIFDELAEDERQKYITGIVEHITGTGFLTDAGVRSRSLGEAELVDHWDYHGSFVSWPKESFDIAKGLRRQNMPGLARELENRIVNVVKASKSYPEFFYVDDRGRVLGLPTRSRSHGELVAVQSSNRPERIQAWTVSAMLAMSRRGRISEGSAAGDWRPELEKQILRFMPHMPLLRGRRALSARYPFYPYELNDGQR